MHWNQFCYIFFQFGEIWSQTRVSFLRNSIKLLTQNLEEKKRKKKKSKQQIWHVLQNDCWAVVCYPIVMANVSYERGIIVLSFTDTSFVILLFVFQRFEIKSGFAFYNSHCIETAGYRFASKWYYMTCFAYNLEILDRQVYIFKY